MHDSSDFPASLRGCYGFSVGTPLFHWPNGLLVIPLVVYKLRNLSLPVAGDGYFRSLPYVYFKFVLQRLIARQRRFTFNLHPSGLDPGQPRVSDAPLFHFHHELNPHDTEKALSRLLVDFVFERITIAYNVVQEAGA